MLSYAVFFILHLPSVKEAQADFLLQPEVLYLPQTQISNRPDAEIREFLSSHHDAAGRGVNQPKDGSDKRRKTQRLAGKKLQINFSRHLKVMSALPNNPLSII